MPRSADFIVKIWALASICTHERVRSILASTYLKSIYIFMHTLARMHTHGHFRTHNRLGTTQIAQCKNETIEIASEGMCERGPEDEGSWRVASQPCHASCAIEYSPVCGSDGLTVCMGHYLYVWVIICMYGSLFVCMGRYLYVRVIIYMYMGHYSYHRPS